MGGLPFTYPSSGGFNFSVAGWSTCGCLAVFPRLKGRKNSSLFFLFDNLVTLILNRYVLRSTIIPGPCSWLKFFHLAVFVFLSQGLCSRVEPLQIRPVFVPRNFVCGFQQSNSEIFEIETLEANCNLKNFFFPPSQVLPPHRHFLVTKGGMPK